jgi:hypothetical protein
MGARMGSEAFIFCWLGQCSRPHSNLELLRLQRTAFLYLYLGDLSYQLTISFAPQIVLFAWRNIRCWPKNANSSYTNSNPGDGCWQHANINGTWHVSTFDVSQPLLQNEVPRNSQVHITIIYEMLILQRSGFSMPDSQVKQFEDQDNFDSDMECAALSLPTHRTNSRIAWWGKNVQSSQLFVDT